MSKRVIITLLQTCMIAGLPRSPAEGAQDVDVAEAKRLVDANMAEYADMDVAGDDEGDDDDRDDHLEKKSVKQLKAIAKQMSLDLAANATKSQLIDAIRVGVRVEAQARLAEFDRDRLIEIAEGEEVEVAEGATDDQIREAILAKAFPPAE